MIVSIVIPTCERNVDLAGCLAQLVPSVQSVPADLYEVIVADDGSRSTARDMVERDYPWVRRIQGPRRGPAANRNEGANAARGQWLVFVDDDCIPDSGFLRGYLAAIEKNQGRVLEGRTRAANTRTRLDEECPLNETGGFLWSCNMAIRRDLFLEMGGFDTGFPYPAMEDVDFMTRLSKAREPVNFVPGALVFHPWRRRRGLAFVSKHAESVIYYVGKHPEESQLVTWRHQGMIVLRKTLVQLPRAALKFGIRGIGPVLAETFYCPIAISQAARRTRKHRRILANQVRERSEVTELP